MNFTPFDRTYRYTLSATEIDTGIDSLLQWARGKLDEIVTRPTGERNFDNTLGELDFVYGELLSRGSLYTFPLLVSPDGPTREASSKAKVFLPDPFFL